MYKITDNTKPTTRPTTTHTASLISTVNCQYQNVGLPRSISHIAIELSQCYHTTVSRPLRHNVVALLQHTKEFIIRRTIKYAMKLLNLPPIKVLTLTTP